MFSHIKFANVPVSDQDRALAFYRDVMGLELKVDDAQEADWRWIEFAIAGAKTRIVFTRATGPSDAGEPVLALVTPDVMGAYETLSARGAVFTQPPAPAPWMPDAFFALLRDSEGNTIMLGSG
jgi:predicted enzyme related to lactoylglutathione lyase